VPQAVIAAQTARVNPWAFHAHTEVWVILGGAVAGYWYLIRRYGPVDVPAGEPVVTRKQLWCFIAGVALLWAFADWPVHDISERYLYSIHMLQHLVFSLAAPPLLFIGTPIWLQRRLLRPKALDFLVKRICRPVPAAIIFNVVIGVGHAPFWVNFTLEHQAAHFGAHLLLFTVSMIMWFPVLNRMPEYPALKQPMTMIYLFIQSILPNAPVAFLTFATGVVYSFYAHVPRPFPISAVDDQQFAGAIMKIGGTLILWSTILVQFTRWYQAEEGGFNRRRGLGAPEIPPLPENLTWEDVEGELSRTQPTS